MFRFCFLLFLLTSSAQDVFYTQSRKEYDPKDGTYKFSYQAKTDDLTYRAETGMVDSNDLSVLGVYSYVHKTGDKVTVSVLVDYKADSNGYRPIVSYHIGKVPQAPGGLGGFDSENPIGSKLLITLGGALR